MRALAERHNYPAMLEIFFEYFKAEHARVEILGTRHVVNGDQNMAELCQAHP
ncbi:MAG: hypothetical protein WCA81_03905 [Rhizomicrobium sp.]